MLYSGTFKSNISAVLAVENVSNVYGEIRQAFYKFIINLKISNTMYKDNKILPSKDQLILNFVYIILQTVLRHVTQQVIIIWDHVRGSLSS